MQGEFNDLKTLIMNENGCVCYIYYFAYQLKLATVAMAKKHDELNSFFNVIVNIVMTSCKWPKYSLREANQSLSVVEALEKDDLPSRQG